MSQTTNQDTNSSGSYLSIAVSLTSKVKCCINNTNDSSKNSAVNNCNNNNMKREDSGLEIPILIDDEGNIPQSGNVPSHKIALELPVDMSEKLTLSDALKEQI